MSEYEILQKIAYCYFEKFKAMDEPENKLRDWNYAEKALGHIREPINEKDFWWRFHEENYEEFRKFIT